MAIKKSQMIKHIVKQRLLAHGFIDNEIFMCASKQNIYLDDRARDWCKLPYPNHPKGCPSYGKRCICPPEVKKFEEVFDIENDKPIYMIVLPFRIGGYAKSMKEKHPEWTERQCRNLLYWQQTVKNILMDKLSATAIHHRCDRSTLIPEAMGMNVIKTLKRLDFPIKVRPKEILYKVGVCGFSKYVKIQKRLEQWV